MPKRIGWEQGFQRPILKDGDEPWTEWNEAADTIDAGFGVVVTPQSEPRHLSHGPEAAAEATRQLAALQEEAHQAQERSEVATEAWLEAAKLVKDADLKDELPDEAPDTTGATKRHKETEAAEQKARKERDDLRRRTQQRLRDELVEYEKVLAAADKELTELQGEEATHTTTVREHPKRLEELRLELQVLDDLDDETRAAILDLDASWRRKSDIEGDLRVVNNFFRETEAPPEDCRDRKANLEQRLTALESKIDDAESALAGTLEALKEAQEHYGQRANRVIEQFKKRFEKVCDDFDVKPTVRYDRIKLDMEPEQINSAALHIEIQFGNQKPLKLRGGLSGGEGAVAGMLLRICMMNSDETNFFVIDEPYQSLDSTNVRLVAEFLSQSQHQVILVVPNSDDPNQYRGVLRGVRVRPKNEDGVSPVPDMIGIEPNREAELRVAA